MYGLVNKAIYEMVHERFDAETWQKIAEGAGIPDEPFISLEAYPDEITYKLVGSASKVLGAPANDILEAFGEYWVLFTGKSAYGPMLTSFGGDVFALLRNLNNLHTRVSNSMPHLAPPQFQCENVDDDTVLVHYFSERGVLSPMVIVLLRGCGKLFDTELKVQQIASREKGQDHAIFHVAIIK